MIFSKIIFFNRNNFIVFLSPSFNLFCVWGHQEPAGSRVPENGAVEPSGAMWMLRGDHYTAGHLVSAYRGFWVVEVFWGS